MASTRCGFDDGTQPGSGVIKLVTYGPTLFVDIGFDLKFVPRVGVVPVPGIRMVSALVDTGATESCIDSTLEAQLNLPIVDQRFIAGVSGRQQVNVHLAQVHIPSLNFTLYGSFNGVHLAAGGHHHVALIGRTFLARFTMVYEGRTGTVTLSND